MFTGFAFVNFSVSVSEFNAGNIGLGVGMVFSSAICVGILILSIILRAEPPQDIK